MPIPICKSAKTDAKFKTVTNLDLQVNIDVNNKRHKETDKSNAAIKGTQIRLKQNKAKSFKKWGEIKHLVQSKCLPFVLK